MTSSFTDPDFSFKATAAFKVMLMKVKQAEHHVSEKYTVRYVQSLNRFTAFGALQWHSSIPSAKQTSTSFALDFCFLLKRLLSNFAEIKLFTRHQNSHLINTSLKKIQKVQDHSIKVSKIELYRKWNEVVLDEGWLLEIRWYSRGSYSWKKEEALNVFPSWYLTEILLSFVAGLGSSQVLWWRIKAKEKKKDSLSVNISWPELILCHLTFIFMLTDKHTQEHEFNTVLFNCLCLAYVCSLIVILFL